MPIYEYRCDQCGHELDALQKISDPVLTDCPACGSASLRKLISAPNFRLKGSGWYETDFKGDKDKQRNLAGDKESKPADDGKKDGKESGKKTEGADAKATKSDSKTDSKSGGNSTAKAADKGAQPKAPS